MKNFLKRFDITTADLVFFGLIVLFFFGTRLFNLLAVPIFTDEAIYLRWSQIMANDAAFRYLPLSDGKPPLFMWFMSFAFRLLPMLDLLYTGRLTSVFAGFFALCGVYVTARIAFKEKLIATLAALFYLLSPFALFYDRLALADSLLAGFAIWSIGLGILMARSLRLDVALILGWAIGLGLLTKTPALFFLAFQPLLFFARPIKNFKQLVSDFLKWLVLFVIVFVEAQIIFSILRLFPLFHMIARKNNEFAVTPAEFLAHPFQFFIGNIQSLTSWEFFYLTPLVVLAVLAGLVFALKKKNIVPMLLTSCFIIPFLVMASINKVIFVRYLLTFTLPLFVVAAYGTYEITTLLKAKSLKLLAIFLIFAYPALICFQIITNPLYAQIPRNDSDQYLHSWPAGWGIKEVRDYLKNQSGKNLVITEGTFGLMPYALELYQKDYPQTEIKPYWPLPNTPPPETTPSGLPVFVLMYQNQHKPAGWNMTEILRFKQGLGTDYLRLYKLNK